MATTNLSVGAGIKVYRAPNYGREDAVITKVTKSTAIVDARTVKKGDTLRGLVYYTDLGTVSVPTKNYWVELPSGYVPGSQGH